LLSNKKFIEGAKSSRKNILNPSCMKARGYNMGAKKVLPPHNFKSLGSFFSLSGGQAKDFFHYFNFKKTAPT
jgi:hypothetical protein